jgi:nucleoside 2-deoxyribosyltransferase
MPRPRIYLAGPEVFLPNANEAGRIKCAVAAEFGVEGVYPLDASLDLSSLDKRAQATLISRSNEELMRSCDAVIANLTPFRGASADAGTAFEVGFMRALARPVFGYSNTPHDYVPRAKAVRQLPRLDFDADAPTVAIEDFDLSENLMIEIAIEASGSRLVRHHAARGQEMTDLTAFRVCLDEARRLLTV